MSRVTYDWTLAGATFAKNRGRVFSCFSGGGGSTMGYKLAGLDVIGYNEVDPYMARCYETNHKPAGHLCFREPIQEFRRREVLPEELYELDILDGSPPCTSFSMAGIRERGWGKERKAKEGAFSQVLDTLFFEFIALAERLQPKIVIAENVAGLRQVAANKYADAILTKLGEAGYVPLEFKLNARRMGVPQMRERIFFIALRRDLVASVPNVGGRPLLDLTFDGADITYGMIADYEGRLLDTSTKNYHTWCRKRWGDRKYSQILARDGKGGGYSRKLLYSHRVPNTVTVSVRSDLVLYDQPRHLSDTELFKISSWPRDYDFCGRRPDYVLGMSVPPLMIYGIASRILEQWSGVFK